MEVEYEVGSYNEINVGKDVKDEVCVKNSVSVGWDVDKVLMLILL